MRLIRSMEDLVQAKEEALERQSLKSKKRLYLIRVDMASCGIAVGARDTFEALNRLVASQVDNDVDSSAIRVIQTGCIGLCALEPIVQVQMPDQTQFTYGKVTPEVARRILHEHIGKGRIVQEYLVENV